ncbi:hypothetical protein E2C01_092412 [Portunus trituberculatus]|uniref:Uncharacterized protein n=1 Tax=Portunus trituberculatus TaxID=210409 RepID=A0A5B7JQH8_PORTR|nr:hypothetical protein [Portunus trituberculatus]
MLQSILSTHSRKSLGRSGVWTASCHNNAPEKVMAQDTLPSRSPNTSRARRLAFGEWRVKVTAATRKPLARHTGITAHKGPCTEGMLIPFTHMHKYFSPFHFGDVI